MRSDLIAYINPDAILHNYRALRAAAPGSKLCAPLKADAYGHGMRMIAPIVQEAGADWAAVATLTEAIELRDCGWTRPILMLGNILAVGDAGERSERIAAAVEYKLSLTIPDSQSLKCLHAARPRSAVGVHMKIDTGMGRMGVVSDEAVELLHEVLHEPTVQLQGVYSHFASADFEQFELARQQLATFQEFLAQASDFLPRGIIRHLANSAATIMLPDAHFDMVRPGLAMYGYCPAAHMARQIKLRPILRVVSHLTLVKELPAGHCVGYAQTFTTKRPTRLGVVPAGYVDGFVRRLSNNAVIGTPAGDAPVIGRISMDQLAVDLTDLPIMGTGTEVTLIDDNPDRPNSVQAIAERTGTISYEVTCLLGQRLQRVLRSSGEIPDGNPDHF
jgi:alanine racemase